jgi:hypothetical protein
MEDVMANGLRSAAAGWSTKVERPYDSQILLSVGIVIVGILVALIAITATPSIDPIALGNMSVFP